MREMNLQLFETPQSGIVGRYQHLGYINVAASGVSAATYELLGFGVTQLDDSPSAQTTSKRYVNQKSATQSIGSYEWTCLLYTSKFLKIIASKKNVKELKLLDVELKS